MMFPGGRSPGIVAGAVGDAVPWIIATRQRNVCAVVKYWKFSNIL